MVDARTRSTVEHGRRIRAVLSQQQYRPQPLAVAGGAAAGLVRGRARRARAGARCRARAEAAGLARRARRRALAHRRGERRARRRHADRPSWPGVPGAGRRDGRRSLAAMTERLADVELRSQHLRELQDIVGAMRAVAAIRLQEAQARSTARAPMPKSSAPRSPRPCRSCPSRRARPAARTSRRSRGPAVLAEHGFTGAFSDQLAEAAQPTATPQRCSWSAAAAWRLLEERGLGAGLDRRMATHAAPSPTTARLIAGGTLRAVRARRLATVDIVFFRHQGGGRRTLQRAVAAAGRPRAFGRHARPRRRSPIWRRAPWSRAGRGISVRAARPRRHGKLRQRERRPPRDHAVGARQARPAPPGCSGRSRAGCVRSRSPASCSRS